MDLCAHFVSIHDLLWFGPLHLFASAQVLIVRKLYIIFFLPKWNACRSYSPCRKILLYIAYFGDSMLGTTRSYPYSSRISNTKYDSCCRNRSMEWMMAGKLNTLTATPNLRKRFSQSPSQQFASVDEMKNSSLLGCAATT